jgi:hypothetical protein
MFRPCLPELPSGVRGRSKVAGGGLRARVWGWREAVVTPWRRREGRGDSGHINHVDNGGASPDGKHAGRRGDRQGWNTTCVRERRAHEADGFGPHGHAADDGTRVTSVQRHRARGRPRRSTRWRACGWPWHDGELRVHGGGEDRRWWNVRHACAHGERTPMASTRDRRRSGLLTVLKYQF